jgi:hypothetical protein
MAKGAKSLPLFLNFKYYDLVNGEEGEAVNFYSTSRLTVLKDLAVKKYPKTCKKNIYIGVFAERVVWII